MIVDHSAGVLADFVCGANRDDVHLTGVNWGRDLPEPTTQDIRQAVNGDPCPTDSKKEIQVTPGNRGRPRVSIGHQVQRGAGCDLP